MPLTGSGGGGKIVQVKSSIVSAHASGTTAMGFDNTIPQNTEGTQFLSLAITPIDAANILTIQVSVLFGFSASQGVVALFVDSTAAALAAVGANTQTSNFAVTSTLNHVLTAGSTSEQVFKVRIGGGTVRLNGWNSGQIFGGRASSSIMIFESTP
jgi:hypothetical protein